MIAGNTLKVNNMSQSDERAAAFEEDPGNMRTRGPGHKRENAPPRLSGHTPVRFDDETIAAIRRFSDDDGMTVSAWVRHVVSREIRRRSALVTRTGFAGGAPPRFSFDAPAQSMPGTIPTVTVVQDWRMAS